MRGVIHVHSRYSYDAELSLRGLRDAFLRAGLSWACMTEHTDGLTRNRAEEFIRECHGLSDDRFLFVPGFEMPYLGTHILLLRAQTFPFREHDLRGSLTDFVAGGAMAVIAHPHRNGFRTDDFMLKHCAAVEVWNSQYDGKQYPRPRALSMLRQIREQKPGMLALAGLDLHRASHQGGPSVELHGASPDSDGILSALRQGRYSVICGVVRISPEGIVKGPPLWKLRAFSSRTILWIARLGSSLARRLGLHHSRLFTELREKLRLKL